MAHVRMLVVIAAVLLPGALATLPESSVVVQWVRMAQQDLKQIPGIQNQVGHKIYALHAVAMWNAVKANRMGRENGTPRWNETAVVAYASHTLLTHVLPWWSWRHDLLMQAQLDGLSQEELEGAQRLGEAEANKVIAGRVADGFARWANYKPAAPNATSSIGKYQFLPGQTYALYPQFGVSKPCLLSREDVAQIASKYVRRFQGYFQSEEYYSDLNFTRALGSTNTSTRTAYENDMPLFWAGMPGTSLMHGQFINISISVLPDDYSMWRQARFFALLGTAVNDAKHACFKVKYDTLFWRPMSAIQLGDRTNRYTPDPSWTPFLSTPPHPSYPSGHQCLSGAAVAAIVYELGTSRASFSIGSDSIPGQLRSFTDVTDVLKETTMSRIYGGIHFRRDNTDGLALGQDSFEVVLRKFT